MTRRVLVVDDEPTIRELIADVLRESGYQVDTAANGLRALETIRRAVPDAIVLDLMMPELDGKGFVDELRRNPRHAAIPILVVTASYHGFEVAQRLGAQSCMPKPFELDALVSELNQLVGQPIA